MDDAATADQDNPDDPANLFDDEEDPTDDAIDEAEIDFVDDMALLGQLRDLFAVKGQDFAVESIISGAMYTTGDVAWLYRSDEGFRPDLVFGDTVKLANDHSAGGQPPLPYL